MYVLFVYLRLLDGVVDLGLGAVGVVGQAVDDDARPAVAVRLIRKGHSAQPLEERWA